MPNLEPKFRLIVTEPAGWRILDRPQPIGQGATSPRAEVVGRMLYAYEIISIDGVAYACLVPRDPNKSEYGRVAEQGGVQFDEDGNYVKQVQVIRAYVKVYQIGNSETQLLTVLRELVSAVTNLTMEIRSKLLK